MKKNNIPLNYRERSNSRISFICSIAVLLVLFLIFYQLDNILIRRPAQEAERIAQQEEQDAQAAAETPQVSTASIVAVGDNYYQDQLLQSGQSESGTWNYDSVYTHVQSQIQAADLAMVSQDSVFTSSHDSVSTYPFAVPTEIGDALVNAGFDVVASASDTINDFGSEMIDQTLNYWSSSHPDISLLGIHGSQEDADTVKVVEVNGIRIALLNYTFGLDTALESGQEYRVDVFDRDKISAAIQNAQEESDCIIFFAHWGDENETTPSEYQNQWAAFLMQQGVDVVIGSHPHVLQPYGRMSDEQGNEMVIFYSLGNFVTGQETFDTLLEGMAQFTIQKTVQNGETSIEILSPSITPLVMHYSYDSGEYGPYLLSEYNDEIGAYHSGRSSFPEIFSVENLQTRFDEIMSANVTPSTGTNLLSAVYDTQGNMLSSDSEAAEEDTSSDTGEAASSEDSSSEE